MIINESEFKGNPTLQLKRGEDEKYPFSFGLTKAKMILESLPEIQAFVDKHNKDKGEQDE